MGLEVLESNMHQTTSIEQKAVGLYAVLTYDFSDFLEYIKEEDLSTDVLELLYKMLMLPNPEHSKQDIEYNKIGADCVLFQLKKRGLDPTKTVSCKSEIQKELEPNKPVDSMLINNAVEKLPKDIFGAQYI